MFTYLDATPSRPSLEDLLEDYWELMPEYQVFSKWKWLLVIFEVEVVIGCCCFPNGVLSLQGVKLNDVEILRVLFGVFPTYRSR